MSNAKVLVIGYGNTLRGDDGVGPYVATVVGSWGQPDLQSLAVPQLTPELAEPLATAELAIFVDARVDDGEEVIEVSSLAPSDTDAALAHMSDPGRLLALAGSVFGPSPRAWLITIRVADLSIGEGLSPTARRGAEAALAQVRALLDAETSREAQA